MVCQTTIFCLFLCLVRLTGLEPARRETPDPKSGASTNSATGAKQDSNLHVVRHQILSLARLPIPPQARKNALSSGHNAQSGCKGTNNFSFHQKFSGKFYQRISPKQ